MIPRYLLRIANAIVNLVTALAMVLMGSYGAYALWDNDQILAQAADVQADLLKLKPAAIQTEETDNTASFGELRRINPDVCGWITMDGTGIDHPILQGENNLSYISRDVYGNFALAGSIFLDSRNDPSFSDRYSLLYGHHMADGGMFGDLDNYKQETFFRENCSGVLILPDRTWTLEVMACLLVPASEQRIFDPEQIRTDPEGLLRFGEEEALQLWQEALDRCRENGSRVLALSTCASEFTDARTVVLAAMTEATGEE